MNKIYIVTDCDYCGRPLLFEYDIKNQTEIGDCCEKAAEAAFDKYSAIPENAEVPAVELYNAIHIIEINSFRPAGF